MWEDHLAGSFLERSVAFPSFLLAVGKSISDQQGSRLKEVLGEISGVLGEINGVLAKGETYVVLHLETVNSLLPLAWVSCNASDCRKENQQQAEHLLLSRFFTYGSFWWKTCF